MARVKRRKKRTTNEKIMMVLGIFISLSMVLSLILPYLGGGTQ